LVANPVYAAIGCAVAMLARSMAGGMTAMLALVFVLDTALTALPLGNISLGAALREIGDAIEGESVDNEVGGAIFVSVAWLAVFLTAAWARFTRTDVT
jgi:ABC-type transport system involved in multi-copper enzyme maturation permease subunit